MPVLYVHTVYDRSGCSSQNEYWFKSQGGLALGAEGMYAVPLQALSSRAQGGEVQGLTTSRR